MSRHVPPKGFIPVPNPAGPGHSHYSGPAGGLVTSSWTEGRTMVHIDVEDALTVDEARQLAADLSAVLTGLGDGT
jgi:hypothetical protein